MSTQWHVSAQTWRAYAAGSLEPGAATSVEAHVVGCPHCQAAARGAVDTSSVWDGVQATVTRPRVPWPLRFLRRLGVPDDVAVGLGAGDGVLVLGITVVAAALTCALFTGLTPWRPDAVFLALAPLVPALTVVAAFDATHCLHEVSAPTPYSRIRLALLRTAAGLGLAIPVTFLIGVLIPGLSGLMFAWLLPSLGLTLAGLVLLTWLAPPAVAGVLSLGWITVALGLGRADRVEILLSPSTQAGFVAIAALLAVMFAIRTTTRAKGADR
jgi:hypothetical protein